MLATEQVTFAMRLPCDVGKQVCWTHAFSLYEQLSIPRYSQGASVLAVPETAAQWRAEHRTARKRAWRAERLGYRFAEVDNSQHSNDIFVINTSLTERQGRPMSDGYTVNRRHGRLSADQTRCPRHRTHTYGVLRDETLVAYLTLHRAGDLAMVSMILGHGDHLRNDIMYLLAAGMVEEQAGSGGWFYYNRHDSGTAGLVYYKERIGFHAADIAWSLT
jgi:hypothetical protein